MNSTLRIIVADDQEVVRLFVARVLEDLGHTCDLAADGQDCLDHFEKGPPYDILFLDLVMPRMDGEATLRAVRERYPATRVVMASVQDDEAAIKELLQEGATAYLTKPILPDEIRAVMDRLLEDMQSN